MIRPVIPAVGMCALVAFGAIVGSQIEGDFDHVTIASETPPPGMSAAPAPDSPAAGAGVESGARIASAEPEVATRASLHGGVLGTTSSADAPIIGDPAYSSDEYATVDETADRLAQQAVGPPPVPPRLTGLNGLPFASAELTGCNEMEFYRVQAGLTDHFDRVGYRESNCRNDVSSWCCHGYWQIHQRYWVPMPECGVATVDDILGTDPIDKQRNACAARVVYATSGGGAWSTW